MLHYPLLIFIYMLAVYTESTFDVFSQTVQSQPSYWTEFLVVGEEECVSLELQTQLSNSGLISLRWALYGEVFHQAEMKDKEGGNWLDAVDTEKIHIFFQEDRIFGVH